VNVQNQPLEEVIENLSRQTGLKFFYSESVVSDKTVTLKFSNTPVNAVLSAITRQTQLNFSRENNTITLSTQTRAPDSASDGDLRKVRGIVIDELGEPVIGANVVEKNRTSNGSVTAIDGSFNLELSPNAVIAVSYIGYATQEINIGNSIVINVQLQETTRSISEVVVTALGIRREEKALGYATQKVGGEQFEKVKGANIATSLTGKISGLTILNSTEFLQNPTIRLRGESPLLILDGVPTSVSLADLNQDDILSIDVLKGATASALYGSRGGGGAIMITTKRGGKKGFSISVNTSNMFYMGELAIPEVQSSYSAGYGGKYNTDDEVWGDKLDVGRMYYQWDPIAKRMGDTPTELVSKGKDNFKNFLVPSLITNSTVSVSQQGENGSVRSSFSYLYNKGQYPNTYANRFRYTVGGEMKLGGKISVEGTMGFTKTLSPNTAGYGYYNQGYIYNILIWTGTEYDLRDYRDYWIKKDELQHWHYNNWYDNPYLMANEKLNGVDNNKTNLMLSANWQILPWMKATLRSGGDFAFNQTTRQAPMSINSQREWGSTDKGYYQESNNYDYNLNHDLLLLMDKRWDKFSVDGLLGGSLYMTRSRSLSATSRNGLSVPGFYSLAGSVESPSVGWGISKKQVNSLFGKITLSYMNTFYLDATGRNDWSSTLPADENSYFYPSAAGSFILSQLVQMPEWLPFWKLRSSWTISKSDLGIYDLNQAYSISSNVWNGLNTAAYPTYIRGDVKPITNRTWEFGTALYLLKNNRLKVDLSYYDKLTYNNTTRVSISPFSGYTQKLLNIDEEYVRRGFEIMLDAVPVQTRDFTWNTAVNWSASRRYYANLDGQYSADNLWTKVGGRTDVVTGSIVNRDAEGNMILYGGMPRLESYSYVLGYSDPDWEWGLTSSLRYKNVMLNISLDGRVGGMSENVTVRRMWQTGVHPETVTQWRYDEVMNGNPTPYLAPGVKVVSGNVTFDKYGQITEDTREYASNDVYVSYENYIKNGYRNDPDVYMNDETFFKLRELSLAYDLPKPWVRKLNLNTLSVALVGQNLLLWAKEYKYADPDKHQDDLASPSVRYMGFNLKLEF
jgi:TonB-linked SusC/RagA family outer membrane protein